MLLYVILNRLIVQLFIKCRVFSVDKDFILAECNSLLWLLVKDDIEFDLLITTVLRCVEHIVLLHFLPCRPMEGIMLHSLVQKVKRRQVNHDITRPTPCALTNLLIQRLHSIVLFSRAIDGKHEHSCQHLIEDNSHGPNIDLVTVS